MKPLTDTSASLIKIERDFVVKSFHFEILGTTMLTQK